MHRKAREGFNICISMVQTVDVLVHSRYMNKSETNRLVVIKMKLTPVSKVEMEFSVQWHPESSNEEDEEVVWTLSSFLICHEWNLASGTAVNIDGLPYCVLYNSWLDL